MSMIEYARLCAIQYLAEIQKCKMVECTATALRASQSGAYTKCLSDMQKAAKTLDEFRTMKDEFEKIIEENNKRNGELHG